MIQRKIENIDGFVRLIRFIDFYFVNYGLQKMLLPTWLAGYNLSNNYDFCKTLSEYSPFVLNEINMRYWMEPLLCNTDFGQSFVESFGIKKLEKNVCPPFIEALENIFRENDVPWEAGDLFGMDANIK